MVERLLLSLLCSFRILSLLVTPHIHLIIITNFKAVFQILHVRRCPMALHLLVDIRGSTLTDECQQTVLRHFFLGLPTEAVPSTTNLQHDLHSTCHATSVGTFSLHTQLPLRVFFFAVLCSYLSRKCGSVSNTTSSSSSLSLSFLSLNQALSSWLCYIGDMLCRTNTSNSRILCLSCHTNSSIKIIKWESSRYCG